MTKTIKKSHSTLYIVPTPIGNLEDVTYRALSTLKKVDYIIAENTYKTKILLKHFSIFTPLYIMNRYNETLKTSMLLSKLQLGYNMALVSDAGTPLINDPGYRLICACHMKKIKVISLPGPCAAITALCSSGLPTNKFCFEGFLPSKKTLRINHLKTLLDESRTLIFYDVKHRITESLKDIIHVFGSNRYVVLVRELTKIWESIYRAPVSQLLSWIQEDKTRIQGEMVLIIAGCNTKKSDQLSNKILSAMQLVTSELSIKKAAILIGYIYGVKKNVLYQTFLKKKLHKKHLK